MALAFVESAASDFALHAVRVNAVVDSLANGDESTDEIDMERGVALERGVSVEERSKSELRYL
jgi:hypothetical protein